MAVVLDEEDGVATDRRHVCLDDRRGRCPAGGRDHLHPGQGHRETTSLAQGRIEIEPAAVGFDQPSRECQAQAGSLLMLRRVSDLCELLEDPREVLLRDSDASVADRNEDLSAVVPPGLDPYAAALGRVLDRVGEQVVEDLTEAPRIRHGAVRADACDDLKTLPVRERADSGKHLTQRRTELQGLGVQLDPPGLDLGEVEYVVDEIQEVPAGVVDVLDPLGWHAPSIAVGRLGAHQVAEAKDRVEGRAQLVAHAGQEIALGLARATQRLDGVAQSRSERRRLGERGLAVGQHRSLASEELDKSALVVAKEASVSMQQNGDQLVAIGRWNCQHARAQSVEWVGIGGIPFRVCAKDRLQRRLSVPLCGQLQDAMPRFRGQRGRLGAHNPSLRHAPSRASRRAREEHGAIGC